MRNLKLFTIVLALLLSYTVQAQKLKVVSGNLSGLLGVDKVSTEYDFSEFGVAKFDKEADYIVDKKTAMNKDKAGHGDEWYAEWESDKLNKYKPKFEELFNNYAKKMKIVEGADVIMLVKTTFIEPGFNVGVMRRPSLVDLTVTFKKADVEIVTITISESPGNAAMGYDFDDGLRIGESYAKAGKQLGSLIAKKVK
jgi:hypothetical protein